jgi:hypothetical protein
VFTLTPKEQALIRIGSIERTIASTLRLVDRLRRSSNPEIAADAQANWEDWRDARLVVKKLWANAQDSINQGNQGV